MATIRGITIDIGADTTGVSKALKDVNGDLSSTQKQLNDVNRLLKLDPKNTELLQQKQKLLAQAVEETKTKLQTLKDAQAKMDENGVDKNSEQYMALQREIISTEHSLEDLERAAGNSNATLSKVGAIADEVAQKADKVAEATRGLSTAAAGALAAMGATAYKAITASDDLNTLAKQTGFTTDAIQKMQYASDLIDVSFDTIAGSMTKLKKNMSSTSETVQLAFAALGVSVKDSAGTMRNSEDVYFEVVSALGNVENETERDTLAMTLFGRSADQLAGIVDDGGEALRAYGQEAENLGLIMSQDTLDGLNQVNDSFDRLKAQFKGTLAQSGAKLVEALLPLIDRIVNGLTVIITFISSLDAETLKTIGTILLAVAAISPIAGLISKIASGVSGLINLVTTISSLVAANPTVLIIGAIIAAIAALTIFIISNWDEIKTVLGQVKGFIQSNIIDPIKNGIQNAIEFVKNAFQTAVNFARNIFTGLVNGIIGLVEGAVNRVIERINWVISAINSLVSAVAGLFGGTANGIRGINSVSLPRMAKGGVLSNGSALVGEAGPELLTVANGRATVQPLTATVDSGSLARALGGVQSGATTVNVQFSGSLAQLANVLHPYITAESTRIGGSLVKG